MNTRQSAPKKIQSRPRDDYGSVAELMQGEGISPEVQDQVAALQAQSRVVDALAELRHVAGVTQGELAKRLGVTQGTVSKWETGRDEDLTLRIIDGYSQATGRRLSMQFGKPMNHVEAVKEHALQIKSHLSELAKLARQDEGIEQAVQAFFGEAFFNLLTILSACQQELPSPAGSAIRMRATPISVTRCGDLTQERAEPVVV